MSGWGSIFNNTSFALRAQSEILSRLQENIASGERVIRASDDAGSANRILHLKDFTESLDSYGRNLDTVESNLQQVSSALSAVSESISAARSLTTQAVNGAISQEQRKAFAGEIETVLQTALMAVNQNHMGSYLFGGTDSARAPFEATYDSQGRITSVTYRGGDEEMPVPVAPGVAYSGVVVGEDCLSAENNAPPDFSGDTGAAAGTSPATIEGQVTMEVSRRTTYSDTSEVDKGDSADAQDTIRGEHTLTIDKDAGTIRLDDGADVSYGGAADPTDLRLTNAAGDAAYVNVENISPGAGTVEVTITGEGLLSIDDGLSVHVTDYTHANLAVSDSRSGRVLYVDTRGIDRTGTEQVRKPARFDLFADLVAVRDALLNEEGLSSTEQVEQLGDRLDRLRSLSDVVSRAQIAVGSRLEAVGTTIRNTIDDLRAAATEERSKLQDADISDLAVELSKAQTLYEMVLASSSRLLRLTLLDYL